MALAPSILSHLTADSGMQSASIRIYPDYALEQDQVYPLSVYKLEQVTSQLASDGPTGLQSAEYVIAAMDHTYGGASQLADAIITCLDGATWSDPTNHIRVQGCFLKEDGRTDNAITEQENETITTYSTECSFEIWFNAI